MTEERPPVDGPWPGGTEEHLQSSEHRALIEEVATITATTREYLPDTFAVHGDVSAGHDGPEVSLEVHPPVGPPVSAGVSPVATEGEHAAFTPDECEEVAKQLAASTAVQLRQTVGDSLQPPAR